MEDTQAYTENKGALRPSGNGIIGQTLEAKQPQYVAEISELQTTLNLLGDIQDRMANKLSPVRSQRLSKAEPLAEPTSSTGESPLVTSLKGLNWQAVKILQNFSNTYDEIDL